MAKYPAHSAMNWSEAKWSLADDDAQDQAKPGGAEDVIFTLNSGDVTMDEGSAALGGLDMAGHVGTLDIDGQTLDIDGVAELEGTIEDTATGGAIEVSGALVKSNALSAPGIAITLNGTGTVTCGGNSDGLLTVNTAQSPSDSFQLAAITADADTWDANSGTDQGQALVGGTLTTVGYVDVTIDKDAFIVLNASITKYAANDGALYIGGLTHRIYRAGATHIHWKNGTAGQNVTLNATSFGV